MDWFFGVPNITPVQAILIALAVATALVIGGYLYGLYFGPFDVLPGRNCCL